MKHGLLVVAAAVLLASPSKAQTSEVLVDSVGKVAGPFQWTNAGFAVMLGGHVVSIPVNNDGAFALQDPALFYLTSDCSGQPFVQLSPPILPRAFISGPNADSLTITYPAGDGAALPIVKMTGNGNPTCRDPELAPGPFGRAMTVPASKLGLTPPFHVELR